MAVPAIKYTSPQIYLALERSSKEKHEYFAGKIMAMAGASLVHYDIVANLIRKIGLLLKDRPCRILPSDIRISIPSRESYMYPDAVIVCDRGKKFFFYRQIPSFKEYILVDTTRPFVELSRRQDDGSWIFGVMSDPEGYVPITAIKGEISMEELYRNVQFAPAVIAESR